MKEPYRWNYTIKIKTKDGEYVYENESLDNIESLLEIYPDRVSVEATQNKKDKPKVKTLQRKRGK